MRECFTYVCYLQRVFFLILTNADDQAFFFINDYEPFLSPEIETWIRVIILTLHQLSLHQ